MEALSGWGRALGSHASWGGWVWRRVMSMSILGSRFLKAGGVLGCRKPRAQGFADARAGGSSLVRFVL